MKVHSFRMIVGMLFFFQGVCTHGVWAMESGSLEPAVDQAARAEEMVELFESVDLQSDDGKEKPLSKEDKAKQKEREAEELKRRKAQEREEAQATKKAAAEANMQEKLNAKAANLLAKQREEAEKARRLRRREEIWNVRHRMRTDWYSSEWGEPTDRRELIQDEFAEYYYDNEIVHRFEIPVVLALGNSETTLSPREVKEIRTLASELYRFGYFVIYDADSQTAPIIRQAIPVGRALGVASRWDRVEDPLRPTEVIAFGDPYLRIMSLLRAEKVIVSANSPLGLSLFLKGGRNPNAQFVVLDPSGQWTTSSLWAWMDFEKEVEAKEKKIREPIVVKSISEIKLLDESWRWRQAVETPVWLWGEYQFTLGTYFRPPLRPSFHWKNVLDQLHPTEISAIQSRAARDIQLKEHLFATWGDQELRAQEKQPKKVAWIFSGRESIPAGGPGHLHQIKAFQKLMEKEWKLLFTHPLSGGVKQAFQEAYLSEQSAAKARTIPTLEELARGTADPTHPKKRGFNLHATLLMPKACRGELSSEEFHTLIAPLSWVETDRLSSVMHLSAEVSQMWLVLPGFELEWREMAIALLKLGTMTEEERQGHAWVFVDSDYFAPLRSWLETLLLPSTVFQHIRWVNSLEEVLTAEGELNLEGHASVASESIHE